VSENTHSGTDKFPKQDFSARIQRNQVEGPVYRRKFISLRSANTAPGKRFLILQRKATSLVCISGPILCSPVIQMAPRNIKTRNIFFAKVDTHRSFSTIPYMIFLGIFLRNHLSRRRDSYKGYFTHVRNFGLQDLLPCPSYVIISKPPQSPPPQKKMTFTLIILNVVEHPRT